jgi:hypothetical protein
MREFWRDAPVETALLVLVVIAIVAVAVIFLGLVTSNITSDGPILRNP